MISRGVQAGAGLGDAEADVQVAVDDARQRAGLELLGAVHDHRVHAEDRQVHRAGAVHAGAAGGDLLEQERGLGDAEAVAAVLLGRGDAEPAALGERVVELRRELVRWSFVIQYWSSNLPASSATAARIVC